MKNKDYPAIIDTRTGKCLMTVRELKGELFKYVKEHSRKEIDGLIAEAMARPIKNLPVMGGYNKVSAGLKKIYENKIK